MYLFRQPTSLTKGRVYIKKMDLNIYAIFSLKIIEKSILLDSLNSEMLTKKGGNYSWLIFY